LWHFGAQVFSQAGAQAGSQAATGQQALQPFALWHRFSRHGFSQATFSQGCGQAFSQVAGSGQQPFAVSQQPLSQVVPLASKRSFRLSNRSRTGVQCCLLHEPQLACPQTGSQGFGQAFSQAGAQGCGHAFSQQATLAQALHSPQPPQFSPNMRSKSSKLNPWLHRATLTRSAPKIVLHFIEQQLLYSELRDLEGGSFPAVHTVYCARAVEPFLGPIFLSPVA
jgi:hypothetical protein